MRQFDDPFSAASKREEGNAPPAGGRRLMFACRPWKRSAVGCANMLEKLQNPAYAVAWPDGWLSGVRFPLYQDFLQTRDRPFAGLADVVIGD